MTRAINRQTWIDFGLSMLDQGVLPFEPTLEEVAAEIGVTKGSFYSHFGGAAGRQSRMKWLVAVIDAYEEGRRTSRAGAKAGHVAEPSARLWMLWADTSAATARDAAMRRWAAAEGGPRSAPGAAEAAAALARIDQAVLADLAAALEDWGMPPVQAQPVARLLAPAFGCRLPDPPVEPGDSAAFTQLLDFIARARRGGPVVVDQATADDGTLVVYYVMGPGAQEAGQEEVLAAAREFAEQHLPGLLPAGNHAAARAAS